MTGDGRFMVNILNNNDTFRRSHYRPPTRLCFYMCVSVHGGGVLSQHALQVVSQHALQQVLGGWYPSMPCRFPGPHSRGKFKGIWLGGGSPGPHTKGKLGGSPGPHTRGKLRGIWSRPTAKGEVQGDLVQAHTQVGS